MVKKRLSRAVRTMLAVLTLAGTGAVPAWAAVDTNLSVPITIIVDIPCAGELVVLSGNLHILFTFTSDQAGGFHLLGHFQPQGVSGLGQTTGAKYQGTGVTEFQTNFKAVPFETTFVDNFKIIGQGPGNNLLVHENFHLTVNAVGVVTAVLDNISVDCK